ncbi:hypothetical protein F4823DRAFT_614478 [Ustulina deusta]|nr:hypothetical protein F4823DRAFT_614478 [Ustulina deusta]
MLVSPIARSRDIVRIDSHIPLPILPSSALLLLLLLFRGLGLCFPRYILHLDLAVGLHLPLQRVSYLALELAHLLGADGGVGAARGEQSGASAAARVGLGDLVLLGLRPARDVLRRVLARLGGARCQAVLGGAVGVLD